MRCPSDMELSKYIVSKNNSEDIEKHLLECNICFDTVNILKEGYNKKNVNNSNFNSYIGGVITLVASLMVLAVSSFMYPNTGYLTTNDINREIAFYNYDFKITDNNIIVAVNDIIIEDIEMSFNSKDLDVFEV